MPNDSTADTPVVRVGVPADIDAVMALARIGAPEGAFIDYDESVALHDIYASLSLDSGIMGVIGPVGGPLEGAVLMRIGPTWYSRRPLLEERSIFVHPDFRSAQGGRATKLIEFAKAVAKRLDMPLLVGVISNRRTEAKVRAYRRAFGEPVGAFFLYNGRTEEAAVGDAGTHAPAPGPADD